MQGKVRRMRESPFNKASGLAKPALARSRMAPAPAPAQQDDSDDEVISLPCDKVLHIVQVSSLQPDVVLLSPCKCPPNRAFCA